MTRLVEHVPSQGIHHAEIRQAVSGEAPLQKSDRGELRYALEKIFGPLWRIRVTTHNVLQLLFSVHTKVHICSTNL